MHLQLPIQMFERETQRETEREREGDFSKPTLCLQLQPCGTYNYEQDSTSHRNVGGSKGARTIFHWNAYFIVCV